MNAAEFLAMLAIRMGEIDSNIQPGAYGGDFHKDGLYTGDDYTELWDAILDEARIAEPNFDMPAVVTAAGRRFTKITEGKL